MLPSTFERLPPREKAFVYASVLQVVEAEKKAQAKAEAGGS